MEPHNHPQTELLRVLGGTCVLLCKSLGGLEERRNYSQEVWNQTTCIKITVLPFANCMIDQTKAKNMKTMTQKLKKQKLKVEVLPLKLSLY